MKEAYYYLSEQFIREYYKQVSANKLRNLNEMNKVLEKYIQLTDTDSRLNRKICTKLLKKQNQQ